MRRGTALLMGVAVLAASRLVPASGDTPPAAPELPRDVCTHAVSDPAGDAKAVTSPNAMVDTTTVAPNVAGLDIQAVDLRVTDTALQVFLGVTHFTSPPTMAYDEASWRYTVTFKMGGKNFTFGAQQNNGNLPPQAQPQDSGLYLPNGYIFMNNNGDLAGATVQFIAGNAPPLSWVVYSAPRDKVEKNLGRAIVPGDLFTNVTAATQDWFSARQMPGGDSLSTSLTAAQDQLVAGDEWCFGPPPTAISDVTVPAAVYHHSTTLSAVLKDENAKALASKPVTFTIHDGKNTTLPGTTDANGLATATYGPIAVPAGNYPVTVTFPGEGTTLKTSTATGMLKVSAQKTAFTAPKVSKLSATTRAVTATLLDDLQKGVAGVKVDWYVNGKKTATTTTDKSGKTVFRAAKAGQKVQARFAGKAGYLLGASSAIAKA
jgi:hypothetical protein